MQYVDTKGLDDLDRSFSDFFEQLPERRRGFHERMAELAKGELDSAIGQSGVQDAQGNVRRWQVKHVGSGGGYAAVRAAGSKEGAQPGPNSPGAITNYLEGGHSIRNPSGSDSRYRPRIRVARVPGFYFYQSARATVEPLAIQEAEAFADQLAAMLGG